MEGSLLSSRPWLAAHVAVTPEALPQPPPTPRKRPFIYVYDLPPLYNAHMLQYRMDSNYCMYRRYKEGNQSEPIIYW
jgi:hypothetical protein